MKRKYVEFIHLYSTSGFSVIKSSVKLYGEYQNSGRKSKKMTVMFSNNVGHRVFIVNFMS